MAKKPVLFPDDIKSNPDTQFDPEYWEGRAVDPSWIHGYSEVVQANDIAKSDPLEFRTQMKNSGSKLQTQEDWFRHIGASPQELPVEFMWLPISGPNGEHMGPHQLRQLETYENQMGFRPVRAERNADGEWCIPLFEQYGYRLSRNAHVGEDGMIRRGPDSGLYYRSGEVARKWEAYKQRKAAEADGRTLDEALRDGSYTAPTFYEKEDSVEDIAH